MTHIEQIRQLEAKRERVRAATGLEDLDDDVTGTFITLLDRWDTRDTALRALVQQWRLWAEGNIAAGSPAAAFGFKACADELARLLEPEA